MEALMERRQFSIVDIHIGGRHRPPDAGKVSMLSASIKAVGLMNPPAVCMRNGITLDDGEVCDNVPVLIYGRHRLLALSELGLDVVECLVYDVDDLHAELMEIDENLARAELSPAQESAHIARRKVLWEEINSEAGGKSLPTSLSDGRQAGPQHKAAFASEVAQITGGSKRDINQKIMRARELGDDINRIPGTSLDKGVELDALVRMPEAERRELIERAQAGEKVSARPPSQAMSADDIEEQRFWKAWAAMSPERKRIVGPQFVSMI